MTIITTAVAANMDEIGEWFYKKPNSAGELRFKSKLGIKVVTARQFVQVDADGQEILREELSGVYDPISQIVTWKALASDDPLAALRNIGT